MKKTMSFTILALAIACTARAQTPVLSISDYDVDEITDGCYFKDTENVFAPFIGTWQWTDGNSSFTIEIEKFEMVYDDISTYYSDYLVGKYRYIENGTEVINTLNYNLHPETLFSPTGGVLPVIPMLGGYEGLMEAYFHIDDIIKDKTAWASLKLIFSQPNGTQAEWHMWNTEHWNINNQDPRDPAFSIPNDIVLTKQ